MVVMKYWAYFAVKLMLVALFVYGLQVAVLNAFPPPPVTRYGKVQTLFLYDMPFTFAVLGVWLVAVGLMSLAIRDQRRRCRTCLRKLIMPVARGSWGNVLRLGRPKTEWICRFGHGTLQMDELHIDGNEVPDWQPHDENIWKELESYGQARK